MNYTPSAYDGPYGFASSSSGQISANIQRNAAQTADSNGVHSASSSLSSLNGDSASSSSNGNNNKAGIGASSRQHYYQNAHHGYDSSGDFDRTPFAGSSRLGGTRNGNLSASQQHHRRAQNSDDYHERLAASNGGQQNGYAGQGFNGRHRDGQGGLDVYDERDASFDFLLSPGLAPVGPISSFNAANPPPLAPPPSHPPPPLPPGSNGNIYSNLLLNASQGPSARPAFNRSQTAAPAMTGPASARQHAMPMYQQQASGANFSATAHLPASVSAEAGPSSQQQAQSDRPGATAGTPYVPPPAISSAALLDVVLRMRVDGSSGQPPVLASSAAMASPMARSHSANAAVRLQQSIHTQQQSHSRNISTGSNRSEDEDGQSRHAGNALQLPAQHPGMSRTASSKNVSGSGPTGLETVDLSHQRISEVPDEVVDVLAGSVSRLALSYNYIATLPPSFSKLGKTLRYLNIRLNMLVSFPPVLCEMPSLEILDISRNKIKRLPANCGSLRNLRVFSISKNRIKRLPTYFADMAFLRVLKIDHNPLEWPPREVVTQPSIPANNQSGRKDIESSTRVDEAQALQRWLTNLQEWIREHAAEAPAALPPLQIARNDEGRSEPSGSAPLRSGDGGGGAGTLQASLGAPQDFPLDGPITGLSQASHNISAESPEAVSGERLQPSDLPTLITDPSRMSQHGRNASHSLASSGGMHRKGLKAKKSLPDLRQNHAQILDERFDDGDAGMSDMEMPGRVVTSPKGRLHPRHGKTHSGSSSAMPSPITARPVAGLPTPPRSASGDRAPPLPVLRTTSTADDDAVEEGEDGLAPLRGARAAQQRRNQNGLANNHNLPSGGLERANSGAYFRRLSMLPALTLSRAVPSSLLAFIDGIRGVLFSLSQIYSSLKQFVVFPAADRLPASLTKVMASADDAMGFLIDALDRFDAASRRASPEVSIVKEVIETCKENIAIFAKLVNVLAAQSKTLFGSFADIRYTRTLVIALYGAMGEVANSWSGLAPIKDDIICWMRGDTDISPTRMQVQPPASQTEQYPRLPSPTNVSPIHQRPTPSPALTPASTPFGKQRPAGIAKGRRHAGSFTNHSSRFESEI